jgi:hypothetical protein
MAPDRRIEDDRTAVPRLQTPSTNASQPQLDASPRGRAHTDGRWRAVSAFAVSGGTMSRSRSVRYAAAGAFVGTLVVAIAVGCTGSIGAGDGTIGSPAAEGDPGRGGPGGGPAVSPTRDPGTKTIHRLNRVEYDNTVRDLLGTSIRAAADFPADDHGYGFDNIADVLSLSPLQVELYDRAAEKIVEDVFAKTDLAKRVLSCDLAKDEKSCATSSLTAFATRAFRRPATAEEVGKLVAFVDLAKGLGGTALEGVQLAVRAVLVSPHFLFRVELDDDPAAPEVRSLTGHEIASRLSYFLWSSMPDQALFDAAAAGSLADAAEIRKQATRMLADPRSDSLITNFAGQWLHTREIDSVTPEAAVYPGFDATLRASMKKETELFFAEFLRGDVKLPELLTANWSFVDAKLATHYGLPAPTSAFAKTPLSGARRGLLGHGSILTTTSYPDRTSPVKRGHFVLEELLCTPPPPPPPGVEALAPQPNKTGTIRERMEAHRTDPVCASCHQVMDPIGFGLENFDGIGRYRTDEGGAPIDASGVLPGTGAKFSDSVGLVTELATDPRLGRCVAQQLYTYALGRGPKPTDKDYLDEITANARAAGDRVKDVILEIVSSEPFRTRRPGAAGGGT